MGIVAPQTRALGFRPRSSAATSSSFFSRTSRCSGCARLEHRLHQQRGAFGLVLEVAVQLHDGGLALGVRGVHHRRLMNPCIAAASIVAAIVAAAVRAQATNAGGTSTLQRRRTCLVRVRRPALRPGGTPNAGTYPSRGVRVGRAGAGNRGGALVAAAAAAPHSDRRARDGRSRIVRSPTAAAAATASASCRSSRRGA